MQQAKINPSDLTGEAFVELVREEIRMRNRGLSRTNATQVSLAAGFSGNCLKNLYDSAKPNPKLMTMRCILYVLGFEITDPEQDVIPHLKKKGVYQPDAYKRNVAR